MQPEVQSSKLINKIKTVKYTVFKNKQNKTRTKLHIMGSDKLGTAGYHLKIRIPAPIKVPLKSY